MSHPPEIADIAPTRGFVDNARALPTIPPAPPQQQGRTFDSPSKADIFTRHRQGFAAAPQLVSQNRHLAYDAHQD